MTRIWNALSRLATKLGFKWSLILLLVIFAIVICLQNREHIQIDVLFWTLTEAPKFYLILVSFLLGSASGSVLGWILAKRL